MAQSPAQLQLMKGDQVLGCDKSILITPDWAIIAREHVISHVDDEWQL